MSLFLIHFGGASKLNLNSIIDRIDRERIYGHILEIEGVKNPIDSFDRLEKAADYVSSAFETYGLRLHEQKFKVPGFDGVFRNIEGALGNGQGAELLIVSHYDTVGGSPGANDNASGMAIMLEAAHVLSDLENIGKISFVCFSLEEQNPVFVARSKKIAQSFGLTDSFDRYTSAHSHKILKRLVKIQRKAFCEGKSPAEAFSAARSQLEEKLNEFEVRYVKKLEKMYEGITATSWPGQTAIVGSEIWVKEANKNRRDILGVLCLETVGYTSDLRGSQVLPENMDPKMFETYNVADVTIGNFLAVVGDVNSNRLAQSFCTQSRLDSIDLPYACLLVPLGFNDIAHFGFQDLLRSDHAPFWRKGIPGLLLTDTADFRYPFYHTQADTIDKLDFDFITKICKATVATAVNLTENNG